jgi:hypothetical protein
MCKSRMYLCLIYSVTNLPTDEEIFVCTTSAMVAFNSIILSVITNVSVIVAALFLLYYRLSSHGSVYAKFSRCNKRLFSRKPIHSIVAEGYKKVRHSYIDGYHAEQCL